VDLAALLAHMLELPNKLALPGPLWLAVQQNLYRGWGPILGPFEVAAVVSTWALVPLARGRRGLLLTLTAAVLLTAVLAAFFALVRPINVAVAAWTPQTLDLLAVQQQLPVPLGVMPELARRGVRADVGADEEELVAEEARVRVLQVRAMVAQRLDLAADEGEARLEALGDRVVVKGPPV